MHTEPHRTHKRHSISVLHQIWWSPAVGWMKACLQQPVICSRESTNTICIFDICHWTKYGCYISNMIHTAITLNGHTDPAILYISNKTQPTAADTSQIIAKYVPEQICPSNAIYMPLMLITSCADVRQLCHYIYLNIHSRQSTMSPQALVCLHFTLLAYAL